MPDEPKVVSVTADDFKRPPKEVQVITLNLPEHPNIDSLELIMPEDLNTRNWQAGGEISFIVVGIKAKI